MNHILVIDDEPAIRDAIKSILMLDDYTVHLAEDGLIGLHIMKTEPIDVVFLDFRLPGKGGFDVLKELKAEWPNIEVVLMSGHASVEKAVNAMKLGAFDFLEKPMDTGRLLALARNAIRINNLKKENATLKQTHFLQDEMIGSTESMLHIRKIIEQSAASDARVMILGENGTGKDLVARLLHVKSKRANKNYVAINCAAIPDNLIESELFGHDKGAFTGASAIRKGKFEIANGGTLFLDEIADMSLDAQAKVLRAVQDFTFTRVGGEEPLHSDVRIIAATNKDIQTEIKAGRFREDLYFRLNVIQLFVPPLRERQKDMSDLIAYFQQKVLAKNSGAVLKQFSPEAMNFLKQYTWPGNIRELKNFIERVNILSDEAIISVESVRYYLGDIASNTPHSIEEEEYHSMKLRDARELFESRLIEYRLNANIYNITQTAWALGLSPSNLQNKIRKFGIEIKK